MYQKHILAISNKYIAFYVNISGIHGLKSPSLPLLWLRTHAVSTTQVLSVSSTVPGVSPCHFHQASHAQSEIYEMWISSYPSPKSPVGFHHTPPQNPTNTRLPLSFIGLSLSTSEAQGLSLSRLTEILPFPPMPQPTSACSNLTSWLGFSQLSPCRNPIQPARPHGSSIFSMNSASTSQRGWPCLPGFHLCTLKFTMDCRAWFTPPMPFYTSTLSHL